MVTAVRAFADIITRAVVLDWVDNSATYVSKGTRSKLELQISRTDIQFSYRYHLISLKRINRPELCCIDKFWSLKEHTCSSSRKLATQQS
jgi:hypothetical protein